MILVLVPRGRGNWHAIEVRLPARRVPKTDGPLFPAYRVGQPIPFDGQVWRVKEVRA